MNNRDNRITEFLRHLGVRSIVVALVIFVITIWIVALVGGSFYATKKEVLQQQGELNSNESAMEYNDCLLTRVNIVTMVGCAVDHMLASGKSHEEIEQYLTDQTGYIVETLDPSTTGLYGWIGEEYLDGAGWVPDDDYVPTERPWYTETLSSDQKITFVEPYVDMQTNSVMMTVSELLSDGKSVLAMDVSLDPLQKIVEQVSSDTEGSQAYILDTNGVVVAHPDEEQLGRNYLSETDTPGGAVARRILKEGEMQFDIDTPEGKYSVYADKLQGGWYSVSLINSDVWYRPLKRTLITFGVILALVVVFLIVVFVRLTAKNLALQKLHTRIDQEEKRGEELQILSETDRMTGLYDRVSGKRRVDELLPLDIMGVFFELDIDHFKSINDTYGHQAGDQVILAVADALRTAFRSNDICMRLGGDEFGVYAVGIVEQEMAKAIIGRLFYRIENLEIPELGDKKISISVGAAFNKGKKKMSFEDLYAKSDTAMYKSKKLPGNSLTFSPD